MTADHGRDYWLLRALEQMASKVVVISPELRMLAALGTDSAGQEADVIGRQCFEALFQKDRPCSDCAVRAVFREGALAGHGYRGGGFRCDSAAGTVRGDPHGGRSEGALQGEEELINQSEESIWTDQGGGG